MRALSLVLLIALASTVASMPCSIMVKFRSHAPEPVRVQMFVPSLRTKTENFVILDKKENKSVKIEGQNCVKEKWVLQTYRQAEDGGWIKAKMLDAKFFGKGWFRVLIDKDFNPNVHDRLGVVCSEGLACGK